MEITLLWAPTSTVGPERAAHTEGQLPDADDLERILSSVHPNDWTAFFEISDQFRPKTAESWRAIADRLGAGQRAYSPDDLATAHAAMCRYFDEPPDATNLLTRALYDFAVTEEAIRRLPFLNLGYHPSPDETTPTIPVDWRARAVPMQPQSVYPGARSSSASRT
jgi:hypothetical protein